MLSTLIKLVGQGRHQFSKMSLEHLLHHRPEETHSWRSKSSSGILLGNYLGTCQFLSSERTGSCRHGGPSIIDHRTLRRSDKLPLTFLRGCGLPDELIKYMSSLPKGFHSCFISYSSKNQDFAEPSTQTYRTKGYAVGMLLKI